MPSLAPIIARFKVKSPCFNRETAGQRSARVCLDGNARAVWYSNHLDALVVYFFSLSGSTWVNRLPVSNTT